MSRLLAVMVEREWARLRECEGAVPMPERIPTEVFQAAQRYANQGDDPIWAAISACEEWEDREFGRIHGLLGPNHG